MSFALNVTSCVPCCGAPDSSDPPAWTTGATWSTIWATGAVICTWDPLPVLHVCEAGQSSFPVIDDVLAAG